ncbi:MAG TPA: hypothetical protein VHS78_04985 [Candidatus Elarobacter sp.]|nr:hypothetical protein [Candidatus Elarobacter sp.]
MTALQDFIDALDGVVACQPRFGMADPGAMRAGLRAIRDLPGPTIGTITVDAFTRERRYAKVASALAAGEPLNGYPIVHEPAEVTRGMIDGVAGPDFPVQVRHGAGLPGDIFEAAARAGIDAIEGGPVSYGMVYGRTPLATAIGAWAASAERWAEVHRARGVTPHVESFAGSLIGQLCPPAMHNAISILEGAFFLGHGVESISLSCAQATNPDQDAGTVLALRRLAERYLRGARWHVVFYHFMGLFPETERGALALIRSGTRSAAVGGAARIIVKTAAEAHHIPTLDDNLRALRWTRRCADEFRGEAPSAAALAWSEEIESESRAIIEAVLGLRPTVDGAIEEAFRTGLLDIPYCLHRDNANAARPALDRTTGALRWARAGNVPIPRDHIVQRADASSSAILDDLNYNRREHDRAARLEHHLV